MSPRRLVPTVAAALALFSAAAPAAHANPTCPDEELRATPTTAARVTAAVDCLVAGQRARLGLPAFVRDTRLDEAARLHAVDMDLRSFFGHVTPEGLTPSDRALAQGYAGSVGENIAFGYDTARAVMDGWMASPGHCRNILSSARDLGIGVSVDAGSVHAVQGFGRYGAPTPQADVACRTSPDAPTGTAPDDVDAPNPPPAVTDSAPAAPSADATIPASAVAGPARAWRLVTRRVARSGRQRIELTARTAAVPRVVVAGRARTLRRLRPAGPGRSLFATAPLRLRALTTVRITDAAGTAVLRLRRTR